MKAFKQILLSGIAHTDAGVADVDLPMHAIGLRFTPNTDINPPLVGVLDGIAEQIEQDLPQTLGVEHHDTGFVQVARQLQLQAFAERLHTHRNVYFSQKVFHVRGLWAQWDIAGLQGRGFQYIVEHGQQMRCAGLGCLNQIGLFWSALGFLQQAQHAQYAVKRRAQFVAHVRQKTTIPLVGPVGLLLGLQQLRMQALLRPLCLILLALVSIQAHSAQHQTQDLRQREPNNPLALLAHSGHLTLHPLTHNDV